LTRIAKDLKDEVASMKRHASGIEGLRTRADRWGKNVQKTVRNVRSDIASVGQGIRFGANRARRHVTLGQRENSRDFRHHDDLGGELGTIKLKIPSFQGKNDPEAYLEWEKKVE